MEVAVPFPSASFRKSALLSEALAHPHRMPGCTSDAVTMPFRTEGILSYDAYQQAG